MRKKSQLKNSIIYILLGFLSPALNFFLIPLYTKFLSTEHYGIITISVVFQAILGGFIGIGVTGAYQRYFFDYESDKDKQILMDTSISINIVSAIFAALFLFIFGDKILLLFFDVPEFTMSKYGWWTLLMALFQIFQTLILSEYRNRERADLYAKLSAVFFLSGVAGVFIGVIFLRLEALGVVAGRSIGTTFPIIFYLLYIYTKRKFKVNTKLAAPLLTYGYPIMVYGLLSYLYKNVDKVIVSQFFDVSTLGLYGFATSIALVTEIMVNAMLNTFYPSIYTLMKNVKDLKVMKEIRLQFEYIFLSMIFFIFSFAAFSVPGVYLFISKAYHGSIIWLPLLFISFISRVYYVVYSLPIFYYKKTKILMPVTVATLMITIGLSLLLIPLLGVFALILVNFLANALQTLFINIYSIRAGILNKELFSFKSIHLQYIILIILICFGYFLYYNFYEKNLIFFIVYYLIVWFLGLIGFFFVNYNHLKGVKVIIFNKISRFKT